MYIKSLNITGLRGFAQPQLLELGEPNGQVGSGLTILLGSNNTGKSTVIEAFSALSRERPPSFSEGKRNKLADEKVVLEITNIYGEKKVLQTVNTGGSETTWGDTKDTLPSPSNIFVLPARRFFDPFFGGSGSTKRETYVNTLEIAPNRNRILANFPTRLFLAQQNKNEFNKILGRILNPVPDWKIDQSQ